MEPPPPPGAASPSQLTARARRIGPDIDGALELAAELSPLAQGIGCGGTSDYLRTLAALGEGDLTVARVVEPHLDALAILHQAAAAVGEGDLPVARVVKPHPDTAPHADTVAPHETSRRPDMAPPQGSTWGVYAAHAPGLFLRARLTPRGWRLDGEKPWCSLAGRVSHAVVTAHVAGDGAVPSAQGVADPSAQGVAARAAPIAASGARRAFAVDLAHAGVTSAPGTWAARGLAAVTSGTVRFSDVPAAPVGPDDWYLTRPGFAWGGIGVAAVWVGGARGLAAALRVAAARRTPDQIALTHLGRVDEALWGADLALAEAARAIDEGNDDALLGLRVRALAARVAEEVLTVVGHGLGPGPLTQDEEHARRVADLTVYVRQHHAERDLAALGSALLDVAGRAP